MSTRPARYVVKSGDTLSAIAGQFGKSVDDIVRRNADIEDPNKIGVGQTINLTSAPSTDQAYVIQPGNTVSELAERFGRSWRDIQTYNHLEDVNLIIAGKELLIPGGSVARGPADAD